jgi:hypothetical protein
MIVALARKTLLNEWRRFLPAVVAVAFSALLLLVQTALVLGIFGSAAIYIEASKGDLWVGYPGTRTVELGRLLPADTEIWVRLDEAVDRVEPYRWIYGDWRVRSDQGAFSMYVSGIDTSADGLMFTRVLPASLRARLEQQRWGAAARCARPHVAAAAHPRRAHRAARVHTPPDRPPRPGSLAQDGPHDAGRTAQDQERPGPHADVPPVVPRGHLRQLRHEH